MFSKRELGGVLLTSLLLLSAACSGKGDEQAVQSTAGSAPGGPVYAPTGNEGDIGGTVSFTGAAATPRKLNMDSDPVCKSGGDNFAEDTVVGNGKLQNVFVYVKSGLPANTFQATAAEVVLDQKGCRYLPHVIGLHTGAALKILNSDQTNHNVHPIPKTNREWNETTFPGSDPISKKFGKPEVLIPVKCNLHPWMQAYVGVLDHPFFAVSGVDGSFSIKGLPPGEYEVEAWHEKFGAKTMKLTLAAKGAAKADFAYDGATAYQPGTLNMQPALVLP